VLADKLQQRARRLYPYVIAGWMVFGLFMRREALTTGFLADDYAQLGMLDGTFPLPRAAYDLFMFSNGTAAEGQHLIDAGYYPWWATPTLRLAMLRPLASLMTALDHRLFGVNAVAFHLHSAFWWFLMLAMIAALYRQLLPLPNALVAFALLICDESHSVALSWTCNRSVFVSTCFSLAMLQCYIYYRRGRGGIWLALAVLAFTIALGFGEYAACMLGYVFAYELVVGSGPRLQRLRAASAVLAPALVYFIVRGWLGTTIRGSGVYVDPLTEPVDFMRAVFTRIPVLIGDLVLAVRADYYTFGGPYMQQWFRHGWVPERWVHDADPWRVIQVSLGVVASALLIVLVRFSLRGERYIHARWLLLGGLVALVPVCGSFPSSRLSLVAQIGFAPLVAAFLVNSVAKLRVGASLRTMAVASLAIAFAAYHVVVPLGEVRAESVGLRDFTVFVRAAVLELGVDEDSLPSRDLILLNAPEGGTSMYLPMTRALYGRKPPRSCLYLSHVNAPYRLLRTAPNAFTITFHGTHSFLETAPEQLLHSPRAPFHRGDRVHAGPLTVTILDLFEGRPQRIQVELDRPLEDPSLLFMLPTADGFQVFKLPNIGESVWVPPPVLPRVDSAYAELAGAA
jgi:hypothetical protein